MSTADVIVPGMPRLDLAAVRDDIRRSYWGGDDTFRLHECATSRIYGLIAEGIGRPAADLLADISTVMEVLAEVEDEIWTDKGWYGQEVAP